MSLRQKLNFEDLNSSSSPGSELRQTEPGTPFTYHTHHGHHGAEDMPRCLNLSFCPPEGMHFVGKELAVAAYIFSSDMDTREVLVEDENSRGDRAALLTLCLGQLVVEDVINLAYTMLTHENNLPSWFLPTTFSQVTLSPVSHSIDTFEYIRQRFMGHAYDLWMIYVPMHRDNHWYLMVIDLVNCKLLYLDSAKHSDHRESRVSQMKFVAFFVENMLEDKRFWRKEDHYKPHPSTFDIAEPPVGQQAYQSVWVCQWMILNWVWENVNLEEVNDQTRMRLALDLVMGAYNPITRDVGRREIRFWDREMQRSSRSAKKGRKKNSEAS
ncbi:Ubiquitin-like-specific protease [Arachis hypogaea]|nr:Ubiquitin-like-specific protease [Arachis hypogaea]